ncbi:type II secretion system protein [Rhodoferax saidenbachensis]|uniref:MSHA biogenesis protein MshO n=1 Tax=Rhodoferax saidenbachensis TaxID=1484693 RepID=A0ABU1ZNA2_9BURK|nr:type II secretion system protein [Rhodoferax saidenbachensis]MDR7306968.1 MSHA biogenesis protein MshO [Rhodoferax saidenbachensis]
MRSFTRTHKGFTLIELVMVIVIMGVIGSMVAVFMRGPIDAYFTSGRRAALTDVADTTVRRMARDIRTALPNSIRTPNNQCLEFIPTKTGGRYRTEDTGGGNNLDFASADTTFNMLGSNAALPLEQRINQGDVIAVYNLGIAGATAYNSDNTSVVSAVPTEAGNPPETQIPITSKQFSLASASNRFQVIPATERVVAYVCGVDGNLHRTVNAVDFTSACPSNGPVIARNAVCNFAASAVDLHRNSLVAINLSLTEKDEAVVLQNEVHVSNTP